MNKDAKCCIERICQREECNNNWTDEEFTSMSMAIKAIEKDIPKTPTQPYIRYGMGYEYYDYYCPSCDTMLCFEPEGMRMKGVTRCRRCGQLINWEKDQNDE